MEHIMKHYCYYAGGILQDEVRSKTIAKMLLRGELAPSEKVLDMQTGLWVAVAKQPDIMKILYSMRKVHKPTFLEFYFRDSLVEERRDLEDPRIPDGFIMGIIPYWSWEKLFWKPLYVYDFFANIIRRYMLWIKE